MSLDPKATNPASENTDSLDNTISKAASCSTSGGGACWTGPRVCPGVALLAAWFLSYPVYYFTGSRNASLVVLGVIAAVLITGLHTRLWRFLRGAR